jgi:hypothetical protein
MFNELIIIIIIIILLFIINTINQCDAFDNTSLSFLNLVLYSSDNSGPYDKMYEETNKYYKTFPNVKTVYYTFSNDISDNYLDTITNILYIKGTENYIPGILDKTIKAFEYFKEDNYDYIIRSNISTLINFYLLNDELMKHPVEYSTGFLFTIHQLDPGNGITKQSFESMKGLKYPSGTSIILSKNTMKQLLNNKNLLETDKIDDVAIGLFFSKHYPNIKLENIFDDRYLFVPDMEGNYEKIKELIMNKNYIFYRNRNNNRDIDPIQLKQIIHLIQNS